MLTLLAEGSDCHFVATTKEHLPFSHYSSVEGTCVSPPQHLSRGSYSAAYFSHLPIKCLPQFITISTSTFCALTWCVQLFSIAALTCCYFSCRNVKHTDRLLIQANFFRLRSSVVEAANIWLDSLLRFSTTCSHSQLLKGSCKRYYLGNGEVLIS